ncbi:phosphate ABC transporter substrate-binding protein [Halogeometricum borinquense DSM 11551]|uniref:Phosphate ABC transporter substrate-binding protein n=1 Tax=Halogeometricum borinquense (strain ATCC 700274 / DSM 11551 / JCM 10706 / KCTC 4070 / PR3) TaxID=469382 RepID=E4NL43_HALBP|nr:phosphate/phosphite/phosphonate ABC transporter substrate-binding protein [Halogeometricum borinquense]ADQ68292.1 phosphate/phosphite/phosphonate ABC transporter, periplasmic binding protein [Halogeometricum borinquense DSM 11551]ELY24666.1 phosphate ABC transporter substrate-binding protein [Halogeometricum borinquense DSM 11551]
MPSRRKFLKTTGATGVAGLTALSGCTGDGNTTEQSTTTNTDGSTATETTTEGTTTGSSSKDSIMFALTPAESDVDVEKQYKPLFNYIESEVGVTVDSTVAADYAAVMQAMKSGQADIADASPSIAIQGGNEDVTKVIGIRVAYGASRYFSLMTTTPDSGIEKLSDLKGKNVAFADRLSTSGSLFPLYMLSKAGLDTGGAPDGKPKGFSAKFSDHSTARETLINRDDVVAAGTGAFSTASHIPKDQFPKQFLDISAENDGDLGSESPELKLLAASDPIPRAPILGRAEMDQSLYSDIKTALLDVSKEDLINDDLKDDQQLWFTGVDKGSVDDYQPVQNVLDELGVTLGQ